MKRNRTAARARARDVDAIVSEIARLIVSGLWRPGVTMHEIAQREGVKPATVEEWAAEAGRLLRIGPDIELYRSVNLQRLDETYGTSPDGKVKVAAVSEMNRMMGLHAPQQHKVDMTVKQFEGLSPSATLAKVREQIAKLKELEVKLMVETGEGTSPGEMYLEAPCAPRLVDVVMVETEEDA